MGKERGKLTAILFEAPTSKALGAEASAASIHPNRIDGISSHTNRVFKKSVFPSSLLRNKPRKTIGYAILFLICASFVLIMSSAVVNAQVYPTTANVTVNPNPVGVGQKVEIDMWITEQPAIANIFHNYRVYITKPDGVVVTLGAFTSDNTGLATTQYVPDEVGNFSAQFIFPGELFNSSGVFYNSSISIPSIFTVQEEPVDLQVTFNISGSGSATLDPGVYNFNPGDNVSISAFPLIESGWDFAYWMLNDVIVGSSNPFTQTIFASETLTAVFVQTLFNLNTQISGLGYTNPAPGFHQYEPGMIVNLSATPISGWTFSYWSLNGVNVSSSSSYSLTMDGNKNLTAVFTPIFYRLNTAYTGLGSIYPTAGTYQYAAGSVVNASAYPNTGWMLSSWNVDGVDVGFVNPYYLMMDSNKTLTAVFKPIPCSLNITVIGSGTTNPVSGIHQYMPGTYVNIDANASSGWRLGYWILNGVNVGSISSYYITTNTSLTAVFIQISCNFNITITGSGSTSPTPGNHQYSLGTEVSVTATPTSGWTFSHWMINSVNTGSDNPCTVTMDENKTITAVFTQNLFSLNIEVSGSGTTNPSPGIHQYSSGTAINVNANPAEEWTFSYWSLNGANVGSESTYTVSINSDCTLTAVFVKQPLPKVTLHIDTIGSGSTNPTVGNHTYDVGSIIRVTVQPDVNWSFSCWLLNNLNVSQAPNYSITMNNDYSLVAKFLPKNLPPDPKIDSIEPSSTSAGQKVTLIGHGEDIDGFVTGYRWVSNIDGLLSTSPSFSTTNLSVGKHTISFEVQDNSGEWSTTEQVISIEASTPLILTAGLVGAIAGSIGLTTTMILFRGKLSSFFRSKVGFKKDTNLENKKEKDKEKQKRKKQKEKSSLELNATLPPRIMDSKSYEAQIDIENTGNSNVKDILIKAEATPGISISKTEKKISSLKAGRKSNKVFPFHVEKNIDRGYYVLRFDVKSKETSKQTQNSYTRAIKIGFLSNPKNSEKGVCTQWLNKHSYVWDEIPNAYDLCNCLLSYNLLIIAPGMELSEQEERNLANFIRSGQSLLILGNTLSTELKLLAKTLGYADMIYENFSSSQQTIRVLNQHPIVSGFILGKQLNLKNFIGNVCVSNNIGGRVVAEYLDANGKPNVPFIVANQDKGKIVFFNFQTKGGSSQFDTLFKNTMEWLMETTELPKTISLQAL